MTSLFKKSPLFLFFFVTACGKNFSFNDLALSIASLKLNSQISNKLEVTLTGTCDPTEGKVTITPEKDPVTSDDYFSPATQEVECVGRGTFSADVTLSTGDGLKTALLTQEKDTALGFVTLDMTSPDRPVVTSPVNGEKINTTNLLQNLVFEVSGTGEEGATVKVTSLSSSCSSKVNSSNQWECLLEPALPNGVHAMNVSQVDIAGNTSAVTTLLIEVISNGGVTPAEPTILTPISGSSLKDVEQTLTGQCDSAASVVNVTGSIVDDSLFASLGNKSIVTTTCSGAGTYSVSLKLVEGDGVKSVSVSQIVNGSASYPSTATYILDSVVPDAPVISSPLAGTNVIDTTPLVRGTGLAGSLIKVRAGVNLSSKVDASCEAAVAASGNWFCELQPAITPREIIDIEATQEDRAGNISVAVTSASVVVDPTLMASPTIESPAFGSALNSVDQTITGTCTTGYKVALVGNIIYAVSGDCHAGIYSLEVTFVDGVGSRMLQAIQIDSDGVVSAPSVAHYIFDNDPPGIPTVTSPTALSFVNNNETEIKGTGDANSTVTVTAIGGDPSGTSSCQATVNSAGRWSCSLETALNDGLVTVSAIQADSAGNSSDPSDEVSYTIDTTVPSSLVVTAPASGSYLKDGLVNIEGTCTAEFTVQLKGNIATSPKNGACGADGKFLVEVNLSNENQLNTVSAVQINKAGTSSPAVSVSYMWDTIAPDQLVVSSPPDGSTISDKTPTISGTGEVGATVYVNSGVSVCTSLVNPNKTWSCDLSTDLVDGPNSISAYQKDVAGNDSVPKVVSVTVDPSAGAAPLIKSPVSGATLSSVTNTITVSCSGSGSKIKLAGNFVDSPTELSTECTTDGEEKTFTIEFVGEDGVKSIQATQVDGALSESPASIALYALDTSVPSGAPVIEGPENGSFFQIAKPSVWGTGEANAKIKVKSDGNDVCTVSVDSSGTWFCPATSALSAGAHSLTATQTDLAERESPASDPAVGITVDLADPTGLTIDNPTDLQKYNTLVVTVNGKCEAEAIVSLTGSFAESPASIGCASDGTYSKELNFYPGDGLRSVQATQVDASGRTQSPVMRYLSIDTTVPLAPYIASPSSSSFHKTANPEIFGTGEPGASVEVKDGTDVICSATVNSAGNWNCDESTYILEERDSTPGYQLKATQLDVATNVSDESNTVYLSIDLTAPAAPSVNNPATGTLVASRSVIVEGDCDVNATVSISGTGINPQPVSAACVNTSFAIPVMLTNGDGDKSLSITQIDQAGNESDPTDVTYTLTTSLAPGALSILAPSSNSFLTSDVQNISGDCDDGTKVYLYGPFVNYDGEDGAGPFSQDCSSSGAYSFDNIQFSPSNGLKVVYAQARDSAGNVSSFVSASYTLDTVSPTVSINNLANINAENQSSYDISGTCSENGQEVSVTVSDSSSPALEITPATNNPTRANPICTAHVWSLKGLNLTTFKNDEVTVLIGQTDEAGNVSDPVTSSVEKDAIRPELTIVISDVTSLNHNAFDFDGTCSEDDGKVSGTLSDGSNTLTYNTNCSSDEWSLSGLKVSNLKDGVITVTYNQTDSFGNQNLSGSTTINKDTVGPSITIGTLEVVKGSNETLYPVSGTCEGDKQVSGTISDGKTSVDFSAGACNSNAWSTSVNVSTLRDGLVTVNASQEDAAGNVGHATAQVVEKDVVAPVVRIGSLDVISTSNEGTYTVSGTCSVGDGNITGKLADGDPANDVEIDATCDAAGEWTEELDVSGLDNASITVTASQTDTAGNVGNAANKQVEKDSGLPTLTITTLTTTKVNKANYTSFDVTGECSESGQDVVVSADDGTKLKYGDMTVKCMGLIWIANLNFTGTDSTSVTILVNHSDASGNAAEEKDATFDFDIVDPVVTMSTLAIINNTNTSTYPVSGACEGDGEVSGTISDGKTSVDFSAGACNSNAWSAEVTVSTLRDGLVTVNASQEDAAGNVGHATAQVVEKDVVAPVVRIGSLDPISGVNEAAYTVSGTCSVGDGNVTGKLADSATPANTVPIDATCDAAGEWTEELVVSGLDNDSITVTASQTDAAGNVGNAAEKQVEKDSSVLVSLDDSNGNTTGFGAGTKSNVEWDVGNSYLKLSTNKSSGLFTSRVMDYKSAHQWLGLTWKTTMPFGKELTTTSEVVGDYSGIEANLMDNVVAIWHMNDLLGSTTATDSTISGNNLNINGDIFLEESGKFSKAARIYDGYFSVADATNAFVPSNFTIQAWVKPDYASTLSGTEKIILEHKFTTGISYYLGLEEGKPVFKVYNDDSTPVETKIISTSKLVYGKWAQVVATFDGTNVELFVNSVSKDNDSTFTGSIQAGAGGTLYVGGDNTSTKNFAGYIDEVALWDEALSEDKITQLYRRGVNRINFQVRGCSNSSCSGAGWVGPDGTSASYFSELNNNDAFDLGTLDPLGDVLTDFPAFSFADYLDAGLSAINTQYIQYRAIFQTDDLTFSPELKSVEIVQ